MTNVIEYLERNETVLKFDVMSRREVMPEIAKVLHMWLGMSCSFNMGIVEPDVHWRLGVIPKLGEGDAENILNCGGNVISDVHRGVCG